MQTNATPLYDMSETRTGCRPRFKPEGWDGQRLHFEDKPFVQAKTRGLMHAPLNMGAVFEKTVAAIQEAGANDDAHALVLSRDLSPWSAEHLFAVAKDVPGARMTRLTGDYRAKVLEGPYLDAPKWGAAFEDDLEADGLDVEEVWFFYTTCPKCAKAYGETYVVAIARVEADDD